MLTSAILLSVEGTESQQLPLWQARCKTHSQSSAVTLASLTVGEPEDVAAMVEAVLAIHRREGNHEDGVETALEPLVAKGAVGYLEAKTINGYGPYLYLRYWVGKTHKSKYIGKAPKG